MPGILNKSKAGKVFDKSQVPVEEGRMRFYARATGETNPLFLYAEAAKAAGYRGLLATPVYAYSLELEKPNRFEAIEYLKIPFEKLLHGEQSFKYHGPICAGDTLTFQSKITDIYERSGGALEFAQIETTVDNQLDERVVVMRSLLIVRNG